MTDAERTHIQAAIASLQAALDIDAGKPKPEKVVKDSMEGVYDGWPYKDGE